MIKLLFFTSGFGMMSVGITPDAYIEMTFDYFNKTMKGFREILKFHKDSLEKKEPSTVSLRLYSLKQELFSGEKLKTVLNRSFDIKKKVLLRKYTTIDGCSFELKNSSDLTIFKSFSSEDSTANVPISAVSWEDYNSWYPSQFFHNVVLNCFVVFSTGIQETLKKRVDAEKLNFPSTSNDELKNKKNELKKQYLASYNHLYKEWHLKIFNQLPSNSPVFVISLNCFQAKNGRDQKEKYKHYMHSIVKYRFINEKIDVLMKTLEKELVAGESDLVKMLTPIRDIFDAEMSRYKDYYDKNLNKKVNKQAPKAEAPKDNRSLDDLLKFIGADAKPKKGASAASSSKAKKDIKNNHNQLPVVEKDKAQEDKKSTSSASDKPLSQEVSVEENKGVLSIEVAKQPEKNPEEALQKKRKTPNHNVQPPKANLVRDVKTTSACSIVQPPLEKKQEKNTTPTPSVKKQGTPLPYASAVATIKPAPEKKVVKQESQKKAAPVVQNKEASFSQGVEKIQQPTEKNKAPSVKQKEKSSVSPKVSGNDKEKPMKGSLPPLAKEKDESLVVQPQIKYIAVAELENQLKQQLGVSPTVENKNAKAFSTPSTAPVKNPKEEQKKINHTLSAQSTSLNDSLVVEPSQNHIPLNAQHYQYQQCLQPQQQPILPVAYFPYYVPMPYYVSTPYYVPVPSNENSTLETAQENLRYFEKRLAEIIPIAYASPQHTMEFTSLQSMVAQWSQQVLRLGGQLPLPPLPNQ